MYWYGLHTVRHVVFELRRIPCLLRAPATKRPCDETAGNEVYPQRNGWRRSVPATKWLVTKCTRDEIAGDEVYPQRNGSDKTSCSASLRELSPTN